MSITTFADLIATPGTEKIFLVEIDPSEHLENWNSVSEGLIGYWSFNDGTGATAEDHSGYGNDGTLEGSNPTWPDGISGKAINFPGTDERVNCSNDNPIDNIGNGDFSISFWMKSKDTVPLNYGEMWVKLEDSDNRIILQSYGTANQLEFHIKSTTFLTVQFNAAPFDTAWHHIVLTVDRSTNKALCYLDGVKDAIEGDLSGVPVDCSNLGDMTWGAQATGAQAYEGLLDECRIYNRVLTQVEIDTLHELPGRAYYADIEKIDVLSVEEDGAALTEAITKLGVVPGYWYYENGKLYVSATSGSIYQKDIVANYRLYFADEAKVFDHHFYEPLLAGVPVINQTKIDMFWGISIISDGQVEFYNHDGFFDEIYEKYAWANKDAVVKLGGEDLPYSEYTAMFTGKILDKHLGTALFDVSFVDRKKELETNIPTNTFGTTAYPDLHAEDVGKPIPHAWGTVYRMPIVNVTRGAGTATSIHLFKIADTSTHGIQAVDQVYVDGVPKAHLSADVSAATFKLNSTVYVPGQVVSADLRAYQSGTMLIENPVDVAREVIEIAGISYNSDNFDTATVSTAVTDAGDFPIGLVVDSFRPAIDDLGNLMKSCMGTLYVNNDGELAMSLWQAEVPTDLDEISQIDILKDTLKAEAKQDEIRKVARVGYRKNWAEDKYAHIQASSALTERLHGIKRTKSVSTLLSTLAGATIYVARMQLMLQNATIEISFASKLQLALKNINDRISLTFKRRSADGSISWLDHKVVEIQAITKRYKDGKTVLKVDDMKGIGQEIGYWTSDNPTFPAALGGGSAETWDADWSPTLKAYARSHFGYWTDDDGFADPSDPDSHQISRWW